MMHGMQKILVPLATMKEREDAVIPIHFVRETYVKKLAKYSLAPLFVSSASPREVADELYALSHGVLLMGGTDFDPRTYGETPHSETHVNEPARDELEIYLIQKAIADKKPILGICRGCQALAIAMGGSLHQHVPDVANGEVHNACTAYDDLLKENKHSVRVTEGTKLRSLVEQSEVNVNSAHHQSVNNPGKNMTVSGVSPEGIVEAIEHTDPNYFCIGLQCHPEADPNDPFEKVFEKFRDAVELYNP
jgi:putative glutamine amidotransferase